MSSISSSLPISIIAAKMGEGNLRRLRGHLSHLIRHFAGRKEGMQMRGIEQRNNDTKRGINPSPIDSARAALAKVERRIPLFQSQFENRALQSRRDMTEGSNGEKLIATFLAKFVLEVLGGGGAIWGFSEACGLRNANTVWFWRPVALSVAAIFFVRWLGQIWEASSLSRKETRPMLEAVSNPSSYQGVPREETD